MTTTRERARCKHVEKYDAWGPDRYRRCGSDAVRDGYCAHCHPEAVAERKRRSDAKAALTAAREAVIAAALAYERAVTDLGLREGCDKAEYALLTAVATLRTLLEQPA